MKNVCLFIIILLLYSNIKSQNDTQTHYVSELFERFISKKISPNLDTHAGNNIYTINDSALFIINQKGFEKQASAGGAKITKLNVITGEEKTFLISPPIEFIESGKKLSQIWIWAMAASKSSIFIAVDDEIWVYHLVDSMKFEYLRPISLKCVSKLEVVNNDLHAFVKNKSGFDWIKINLTSFEVNCVRTLTLTNPFFLQIEPVKMFAINNNALYLLQQNTPVIEKYSLTGELLIKYTLKIPNWRNIPEMITRKLDSIENLTERNYAFSKYSIFDYNFMHLFYPFSCERFFMIALDRNNKEKTFITPYFVQIIGDTTVVLPYSVKLNENEKFGNKYFPFLTARAEGNLIFAYWNEYITQINRSDTVSWLNKTQKEFQKEVNLYHRDHEPVEKIETYYFLKNDFPIDSVQFLDYDDNLFSLYDVTKEKAIFIISQYPQCKACITSIWNYFSQTPFTNIDFYNVTPNCPTYLLKKENIREVKSFLKIEFTPLFIDTKQLTSAIKNILAQKANPVILLYNKKLQHIEIISSTHIIGDVMGNISSSFIKTIKNFAEN